MPTSKVSAALTLLLLTACSPQAPLPQLTAPYVDKELLLGIDRDSDAADRLRVLDRYGIVEVEHLAGVGVTRVALDDGLTVAEAMSWIEPDPDVDFVEPNYEASVFGSSNVPQPDDPWFEDQWHMSRIGLPAAWEHGTGEGIVVAVLDTGTSDDGYDGFDDILPGGDMIYGGDATRDAYGHGTHVAGTIAQASFNGIGTVGVAPGATILPGKVLSDSGYGSISAIAGGMEYAADEGASVINMSLGSGGSSEAMRRAEEYAHARGVVILAASGNEDSSYSNYPAADPLVISVGSTTSSDRVSGFSNGDCDIVAPGSYITQEVAWGGYQAWSGTSMATPHAAGAAALIMAQGITDPEVVRNILQDTAVDLYEEGVDLWSGHGRIDVEAAVLAAIEEVGGDPGGEDDEPDNEEDPNGGEEDDPEEEEEEPEEEEPTPDSTAPEISGLWVELDTGSLTIHWDTDEPATSDIEFDAWGLFSGDGELSLEHSRAFTVQSGQRYDFRAVSTDEAGNTGTGSWWYVIVP